MFRYERPQKGRMREFWQMGVEAAGISDPFIDAEVIWLLNSVFSALGFKNLKLLLNSVGCVKCRKDYINIFRSYIKPDIESFCPDCLSRYETNPLRIFDCKVPQCRGIIEGAPKIYEHICEECRIHINKVCSYLGKLGINYIIKKVLVRGFDYYTKTIFEIISDDLESVQNALGGGGRYDNLIAQFGGPDLPSIGFAIGIDRTAMLMQQLGIPYKTYDMAPSIYIALMSLEFMDFATKLMKILREKFIKCDLSYDIRPFSSQIKAAAKNGFSHFTVIGEDEIRTGQINIKELEKYTQVKININDDIEKIAGIFRRNQ
jgi:histidyl-tRNA synthetase